MNLAIWTVWVEPEFEEWLESLTLDDQDSVYAAIKLLSEQGHRLGRPHVDSIKGSKVHNLKELRVQRRGEPYRAFFAFDPLRQAVILCGGNKQGDKRFYDRMIPIAEMIYTRYLLNIKDTHHD